MKRLELPSLKFGGTSWVVRGTFAENLRELSKETSHMQLVLFDGKYGSNIPSKDEVRILGELAKELDMRLIVHFPADICMSSDYADRVKNEDICIKMTELFEPVNPYAYILHVDGEQFGSEPSRDMKRWFDLTNGSLTRLANEIACAKEKICVETLDYNYKIICPTVREYGFSACIDIGHLVRYHHPVIKQLREYMDIARVFHIHGVLPDGTDHVDMSHFDAALFREIVKEISSQERERLMTIEVFEEDYNKSLKAIKNYLLL